MAFVHLNWKEKIETYAQLSQHYLFRDLKEAKTIPNITDIHWVNDRYDQVLSINSSERQRRSKAIGASLVHHIAPTIAVPRWDELLANKKSKAALLQFMPEDWVKDDATRYLPLTLSCTLLGHL